MSPKLDTDEKLKRVPVLMPLSLMKRLDAWRGHLEDVPNRAEAIRRLIEAGLDAMKKAGKSR